MSKRTLDGPVKAAPSSLLTGQQGEISAREGSGLRLVLVAAPPGLGPAILATVSRQLPGLATVDAEGVAKVLGLPTRDSAQVGELKRSGWGTPPEPFAFELVLRHPQQLALLDQAQGGGNDLTLVFVDSTPPVISGQAPTMPPGPMAWLPLAIERARAALIFDNRGKALNLVLEIDKTRLAEPALQATPWVEQTLLQPLQQRAIEWKKLERFTQVNDLSLQPADITGRAYEGRMQVQTEHFITQNVGDRTLVVHDKVFVGQDLQPGQALHVDYSQYPPDGHTVLVAHLGPPKGKDLGR